MHALPAIGALATAKASAAAAGAAVAAGVMTPAAATTFAVAPGMVAAAVMEGAMATSAVLGAAGQIYSGVQNAHAADFAATEYKIQARQAEIEGRKQAVDMLQKYNEQQARAVAQAAAGPGLIGSPISLLEESRDRFEFNQSMNKLDTAIAKKSYLSQADELKKKKKSAIVGGITNAAVGLLGTAVRARA